MSSTDATVIGGAHLPPADAPAIEGVEIGRELGRGGMGAVWLGRQTYLDRPVAVKALTLAGDAVFAERFRREARILAGLAHPHIVACHQAGIAPDGRPFLVMEFVDGPDLKKHVATHGPLPASEAARLVAEVAEGLRHAHAQGIIHRDVKPENVLLTQKSDGSLSAKLADLGLARPAQPAKGSGQDLTAAGQVLGTPATMAPEQFDDPEAVDQRADIYGLGCVLHFALTAEPAFTGRSFAELVASKVGGVAPDPSRRRSGLPRGLAQLCVRMLAPRREDRPDYDTVIATLRATPTQVSRPRWPWAVGVAALVAVGLGVAFAGGDAPPAPVAPATPVVVAPPVAPPPPAVVVAAPARLTEPLDLFGAEFDKRLRGWNVADPLAWGVSEDIESFPVAGSAGEIVRTLPALPGRISVRITVPVTAKQAFFGVRDADGRTTGLKLWPLNGLTAVLSSSDISGAEVSSAGSAIGDGSPVGVTLILASGRLSATLSGAAVAAPLVIDLPAPPVAVVLAAEGRERILFEALRAEP